MLKILNVVKVFWEFNSSLLQDPEYVTLLKKEIKIVIEDLTEGQEPQKKPDNLQTNAF